MKNSGFINAFKGEMYKLLNKKFIKFLIALIVVFIVFTAGYKILYNTFSSYDGAVDSYMDPSTYPEYVDSLKVMLQEYEKTETSPLLKLVDTSTYSLKANIALYQYAIDNNIDLASYNLFGNVISISSASSVIFNGNAFVIIALEIMAFMIIIFSIVHVCKVMVGEVQNGTMKMQLLRPISRDAILSAKYITIWAFGIVMLMLSFILALLIGLVIFKFDSTPYLMVINATKVVKISAIGVLFIYLLSYITILILFTSVAMGISNIVKTQSGAISLTLVIYLIGGSIEKLAAYIYVGFIGIAINSNWINALTTTGPTLNYMNTYSMILISILWIVLSLAAAHLLFKRRDIQ